MKLTITQRAGEHMRFAPDAFDKNVGREIDVRQLGKTFKGVISSVEVTEKGDSVHITFEVEGDIGIDPTSGAPITGTWIRMLDEKRAF